MLLSDEELEAAYLEGVRVCAETTDDDGSGWDIAGLRAVEVAVLARASKPVQVEVTNDGEPCSAELWSWDYFNDLQVDPYWMRCHLVGQHDEHENSETGATWRTEAALGGGDQ